MPLRQVCVFSSEVLSVSLSLCLSLSACPPAPLLAFSQRRAFLPLSASFSCVHPECLERWINTRAELGQERHACEVCRAPYNIAVEKKFTTGNLCSLASWSQYFTCAVMILMGVIMAFVIVIYVNSEEYKSGENEDTNWVLWSLTAATFVLFLSTLKKIYERWRDVNVTERVQIHERADPDAAVVLPVQQSVQGALVAEPFAPQVSTSALLHAAAVHQGEQSV